MTISGADALKKALAAKMANKNQNQNSKELGHSTSNVKIKTPVRAAQKMKAPGKGGGK